MSALNLRYICIAATLSFCSTWQYGYVLSYVNTAEDGFQTFLNQSSADTLSEGVFGIA